MPEESADEAAHRAAADAEPAEPGEPRERPRTRAYFLLLSLGALGVIYGDIGTSPLYAVRESFAGSFGVAPTPENVLGVLSLITWSLVLIVGAKYLAIVLRADNEGEGGILALTALVGPANGPSGNGPPRPPRPRALLVSIGLFGAALLFGDGILTPAISVLSAMEGLEIVAPSLAAFVVPITVGILAGLFLIQRRGTAQVATLFGPIMLLWFLALAALGVRGILLEPRVLAALDPTHAVVFFATNGTPAFLVLAAVFLVVTGSEALYADLGHFGPGPIRFAWFFLVFPALLLNYFGQGGLVISDPATTASPFYLLAPPSLLIPLLVLSTTATVIASQAIISAMFSLGMQAVQLGYWPRMDVRHTSAREYGQIYLPAINWALFAGTVGVVLAFRSSAALASAYGVAIVCTMLVTTLLLYVILPERWGWPPALAALLVSVFLAAELAYLAANLVKVHEGGWFPLAVAALLFVMMVTWRDGRAALGARVQERLVPLQSFVLSLHTLNVQRVQGNAVYMTGNARMTPPALLMNLEHQSVLHERVLVLMVENVRTPHVARENRVHVEALGGGIHRVIARYGFLETPNVLRILFHLRERGLALPLNRTTFFLGRERILTRTGPLLARWRVAIFSFMGRNSQRATAFFKIPPDRVVEVGSQIEV